MTTSVDNTVIGVKLAFDGQIRRFPLATGTSFKSLHEQVIQILGLDNEADLLLKYTDEEGDNVTITSDLELNSALVPGQLLRLLAEHRVAPRQYPSLESSAAQTLPTAAPADATGMFRAFGHGGMEGRGPAPWECAPPHFGPPPHEAFGPHGGFGRGGAHFGRGGAHFGRGGAHFGPHGGPGPHGPHGGPPGPHGPHGGPHGHPFGRGGFGPHPHGHHGPHGHRGWDKKWEKEEKKWHREEQKWQREEHKLLKRAHKMSKDEANKLVARFSRDVSTADGTVVAADTPFVKTWRLRNEGPEWPAGCVLLLLGKHSDKLGGPEQVPLPVPGPVATDAEVDITVNLISPKKPGRYVAYYKMCTPDGRKFGQRVWVSINVPADSSSSSSSSSSDEEADRLEGLVDSMMAMGFEVKRHKLFRLLKKNDGDVEKVTRKLEKFQKKRAKKDNRM